MSIIIIGVGKNLTFIYYSNFEIYFLIIKKI